MTIERFGRLISVWLAITAIIFCLVPSSYAKKKKTEAQVQKKSAEIDHSRIDTSKLVWPLPPDIPRIRFMKEIYGEEKPPLPAGQKALKKKQGWMDRIAGLQTTDSGAVRKAVTHIMGKPYGIGVDSKGRVYVADSFVSAVFIFNLESRETKLLRNGADV